MGKKCDGLKKESPTCGIITGDAKKFNRTTKKSIDAALEFDI